MGERCVLLSVIVNGVKHAIELPDGLSIGRPFRPLGALRLNAPEGQVILIDVSHVHDRFTPDLADGAKLHIVQPHVRIQAFLRRFPPKSTNAGLAGIGEKQGTFYIDFPGHREMITIMAVNMAF